MTPLTYEQITAVTQNPAVIWVFLIIWVLPIIIYIIIASVTKSKTSSGKIVGRMIFTRGTIIVMGIWLILQGLLFLLLIFPIWTKILI